MKNLNTRLGIKHALERKLGYGALTIVAKEAKVTRAAVTNAIKKRGKNATSPVLAAIATMLGQPVYGVEPVGEFSRGGGTGGGDQRESAIARGDVTYSDREGCT